MAATVREILHYLNEIAPPDWAFPNDPIGLQIGDPAQQVERVLVALDPDPRTVANARYRQCQLLITHHPLIYRSISHVRFDDPVGMAIQALCEAKIALIAVHTNWDVAPGGVNDALAEAIGLQEVRPFGKGPARQEYKLVVFTPKEHTNAVIDAMAEAGAGIIGLYRRCAFYAEGIGTYEPMEGANPYLGQVGKREYASEYRIEMLVPSERLEAVIQAMLRVHPYEEVAYDVYPLHTRAEHKLGRVGALPKPMLASELRDYLAERLGNPHVRLYGKPNKLIRTVAVVGGAGSEYLADAQRALADALLTGEVRHHHSWEAWIRDVVLFEGGHAETEMPGVLRLADRLREFLAPRNVEVFTQGGVS
ncbi:MAG: Nif3-like dinuclear metal center hexameric protein [Fimbriimonadales bacterium]|nr:Nif3-like dinuclear metal center hexameric protein [Fimbriimonadales bacterium]MDW8052503.1 Nif3-like dinuclear metal center hexameric protein [Armatimonadota bacterium]